MSTLAQTLGGARLSSIVARPLAPVVPMHRVGRAPAAPPPPVPQSPARPAWTAPMISAGRERMPDLPDAVKARAVGPIVEITARAFRLTPAAVRGPRRMAEIVRARHAAMWIARRVTRRSLHEIGRKLGDRDHTSVLHGCRRVEAVVAAIGAPAEDTADAWAAHLAAADWPKPRRQRD